MRPAAAYLRSSDDQQEASVPEQQKHIREYAASTGREIVEEFIDDGVSGTSTHRPGLNALIDACEDARPWDTVFVWDRSRLGRPEDPIDLLTITSRIAKAGKKIVPLHGAQTTGNKMVDGIIEFIEFGQAGEESIRKGRDVVRGQCHAAERGSYSGGRAPYGADALYMVGNTPVRRVRHDGRRKLELSLDGKEVLRELPKGQTHMPGETKTHAPGEPKHVEVVKRMYREYRAGASVRSILVKLNEEGVPAPRGGAWCEATVKGILRNPVYKGDLAWNRTTSSKFYRATSGGIVRVEGRERFRTFNPEEEWVTVEGAWEGLVSVEEWEAVNARLRKARKTPRALRGKGSKSVYLAAGIMDCGKCGRAFSGTTNVKKGKSYSYYRCGGTRGGRGVCSAKSVKVELIDGYLERRIGELYHAPALDECLWRKIASLLDERLDAVFETRGRNDPARELARAESGIARVVDAIADGLLSRSEAETKLSKLRQEKKRLEQASRDPLAGVDRRTLRNWTLESARRDLQQEITVWEAATPIGRKQVVREHVRAMHMDEERSTVQVEYRPWQFRIHGGSA